MQHEADLAEGCLSVGLTALRNATVSDKRDFYSGFFNTTIGFERLMKLIVVVDHMLDNDFKAPSKAELKNYGHDLVSLYQSSVDAAAKAGVQDVAMPQSGTIEHNILTHFSKFAKFSRYYNLDSLGSNAANPADPLVQWEEIINSVISTDVPAKTLQKILTTSGVVHDAMKDSTLNIQQGMKGESLSLLETLSLPMRQSCAAPYLMVRVFNLLIPIIETVSDLGDKGFYTRAGDGSGPHVPLFRETLVYFKGNKSQIKRKKKWP